VRVIFCMTRNELLHLLTTKIISKEKDTPVLVGIDGVDASGKTTLSDELINHLRKTNRPIIKASIDGFHNPKQVRYRKGRNSPEGYYLDSFNYQALIDKLLLPLSLNGSLQYRTKVFNFLDNREVVSPIQNANHNSILIMEGIFLFRPQIVKYWDFKIFLDVHFKITLKRNINRTMEIQYLGSEQEIVDKYKKRYMPGQKLYFKDANPKEKADIVIDNNNFENPIILMG